MFKYRYIYNMDTIDTYDIYNIEYTDDILDTYYKIVDYCDPMYVNMHNKPDFAEFFNIIYRNVDIYNSSEIIKKIKKNEEENELFEREDNHHIDSYEYN